MTGQDSKSDELSHINSSLKPSLHNGISFVEGTINSGEQIQPHFTPEQTQSPYDSTELCNPMSGYDSTVAAVQRSNTEAVPLSGEQTDATLQSTNSPMGVASIIPYEPKTTHLDIPQPQTKAIITTICTPLSQSHNLASSHSPGPFISSENRSSFDSATGKPIALLLSNLKPARTSLLNTLSIPKPQQASYRATADYLPKSSNEIQVSLGDLLIITRSFKDDWILGKNESTQAVGLFPATCLGAEWDVGSKTDSLYPNSLAPVTHTPNTNRRSIIDFYMSRSSISKTPSQMEGPNYVDRSDTKPSSLTTDTTLQYGQQEPLNQGHTMTPQGMPLMQKWLIFFGSLISLIVIVCVGINIPGSHWL
ncbi:hypothetical protein BASA50_003065 [Batrachochytrium salamandrivorans]|uniref:SH3 domain-containing protein n=1 Tax=Batrachochytrium salamandrivorans TaxID=1357716 RepID=A0ABQ8FJI6_9FUNG|nr:hypothetical protein BASA62_005284 [Batrachochytrium salamandrivorans]KAH6599368.1 hypothetical protein BASA50_003065 [Batrachochytrium salamandrivorans]KAH6602607.1 hypothetical protein BASA61_000940 [Batrachochytrium salamandrivorans]KAH9268400.1 hypothetical protein BASA83_009399 [Batrachochytrium salamandrivorans]